MAMYSRSFQPFGNAIENLSIRRLRGIEARGIKENQAVAFEFRTFRNGIDDYRQRSFGKRARCTVPDWRDNITQSNVNKLGTSGWTTGSLLLSDQAHRAFSSSSWTHNASTRVRYGLVRQNKDTNGKTMSFGPSSLLWLLIVREDSG